MKKILLFLGLFCLVSCENHHQFLGYVEGKLTYISSPIGGKLSELSVVRGQGVKSGDPLFQLEAEPESLDLNAALAAVNQVTAELNDKSKGSRPSELNALSAQIDQAQAQVDYAKKDLERKQQLFAKKAIEQNQVDLANQNLKVTEASLKQLKANLTTQNLGAREDQVKSLQAQLENAKANLEKAQWGLAQKTVKSPAEAQVFDTYYRVGEQVGSHQAVLSLLAPQDIKIIFFVDESALGTLKIGQKVMINCDACQKSLRATIQFISPSAEYTPPIIFSRSARSKLVYEVEAVFDPDKNHKSAIILKPGQPVEVSI
jgi:HlyD family secretion protein